METPIEVDPAWPVWASVAILVLVLLTLTLRALNGVVQLAPAIRSSCSYLRRLTTRVCVWVVATYCGCQLPLDSPDDEPDLSWIKEYLLAAPTFLQAMIFYATAIVANGVDYTIRGEFTEATLLPLVALVVSAPMLGLLGDLTRPARPRPLNRRLRAHALISALILLAWLVHGLYVELPEHSLHSTAWLGVLLVVIALGGTARSGQINTGNRIWGTTGVVVHAVVLAIHAMVLTASSHTQPVSLVVRLLTAAAAIYLAILTRQNRFPTANTAPSDRS